MLDDYVIKGYSEKLSGMYGLCFSTSLLKKLPETGCASFRTYMLNSMVGERTSSSDRPRDKLVYRDSFYRN